VVNRPGIQTEDLCFRIGSFQMRQVNLRVEEGEYFVLTGPNGSGKSLLIKLLCGLYRPDAGTIRINGGDVAERPPWERNIGYVPQEGVLFPNRSVRRNIAFGLELRRLARADRAAAIDRIAGLLNIPHLLERSIDGLSGGERQKVCLARALVLEPHVLLLDEPVSAIDEGARDALCHELRRVQRHLAITTLHVSHNRRETRLVADRVGLLEDGRLSRVIPAEEFSPLPEQQNP
jgi:ABC-type sugar transport system ATPase subunit